MIKAVKLGKKEILLVGTAHVSKDSVEQVKNIIKKEKPDVVAVELCEKRYESLRDENKWKNTEISKIIKEGRTYLFLANLLLSNFQRKIGDELGVKPGAEMLAAAEASPKKLVLVDRDIQITLKRALKMMGLWEKLKVFFSLFFDTFAADVDEGLVEELKKTDVVNEAIAELARMAPSVKKVLVDERDSYIAAKISKIKAKKIVVVVGAGHLKGIKEKLGKKIDLGELENVPKESGFGKYVGYLIPAFFIVLLLFGFYTRGFGVTLNMLKYWFLINGVLSAVGAAIALGHPVSILTAFLAAPFTSLNPAIAAGWFAGYAELKVRNPKVKDFEGLNRLGGLKDFWKNRVTRILLVVAFANLGSVIGTFVALPYIASLL